MEPWREKSKHPQYSLSWARSVVDRFLAEHARATETLYHIAGLSSTDLVKFLASGDPSWRTLKKFVHFWEKNGRFPGTWPHREISLCKNREIPRLTGSPERAKLEEPGFQGGFRPKPVSGAGRKRPLGPPSCFWSDRKWLLGA